MTAIPLLVLFIVSIFSSPISSFAVDSDPALSSERSLVEPELISIKPVGPGYPGCQEAIAVACSDALDECHKRAAEKSFYGETYRSICRCPVKQDPSLIDGNCFSLTYMPAAREVIAQCTLAVPNYSICTHEKLDPQEGWVPFGR